MKQDMIRFITVILAGVVLAVATAATATDIAVRLDPAEISLGESAQLNVTVEGRERGAPQIPPVAGLSFAPIGQSSQIRIVNGAMSANVTHSFAVIPDRAGSFNIPAIKIGNGRSGATSQPVTLKVLPPNRSSAARTPLGNRLPPPNVSGADAAEGAPDENSFGFLRILSPKKDYYVGELVPVELRAYFRAGVELRVDGLPQLNSDAFAMNKLSDEPARSQQLINGVRYSVFSWTTAVTALKAGDYQLSVQLPTTVTVRQSPARPRSPRGSLFDDDFFSDAFDDAFFSQFFGRATQKQVVLASKPDEARIRSLPDEGRPKDFSGAVGHFDFSAEATPAQVSDGDPVTLKLKISGSGNFDRVTAPAIEDSDAWKSYKSSATFTPADSAGTSGAKTFEQALVPRTAGKLEIPALTFSYFDPEQKQYITRDTKPMLIEVGQGQLASAPASRSTTPLASVAMPAAVNASAKSAPAWSFPVLPSWLKRPWVIATPVGLALAIWGTILWFRRQQRIAHDPRRIQFAEAQAAVAKEVQIMESAVERGATLNFFTAARRALQIELGRLWNLPPQTITQVEINARMGSEAGHFWPVFEAADQVTYTGRVCTRAELRHWRDSVKRALARLG